MDASPEAIAQSLLARGQTLRDAGPGRVKVNGLHDISQVRLLRDARASITDVEKATIGRLLSEVKTVLHGIEVATAPKTQKWWKRLVTNIINPTGSIGGPAERQAMQWKNQTLIAGGPAPLDAPKPLMDAAEAWLVASFAEPKMDGIDLATLQSPWETASVASD